MNASIALVLSSISIVVAAASLGWNVWVWRKGRQSQLKLTISAVPSPDRDTWGIKCACLNMANHKVYVNRAIIQTPYRRGPIFHMLPYGEHSEDRGLEPRQEISFYYPGEELVTSHYLDNLKFVVYTDDTKAQGRNKNLVSEASLVAVLVEKGEEWTADSSLPALAIEKEHEWAIRYLANKRIVQLKEGDDGKIAAVRLTRQGRGIARRWRKPDLERSHIKNRRLEYRVPKTDRPD